VGGSEAADFGDSVNGVVGVLEEVLGTADSFGAQPLQWCVSGRLAESPGEGSGAHQGVTGEVFHPEGQL
jgi:hypothetical protein